MLDNRTALDVIEQAQRATPFCSCGQPTSPTGRDGNVWLECISLRDEPTGGPVARFLRAITEPAHVREIIIDNRELMAASEKAA
jgi:hypothetical protein